MIHSFVIVKRVVIQVLWTTTQNLALKKILDSLNIAFESGDLPKLIQNANLNKRTMDFIIPDKQDPKIIIESSFWSTTSSGQGNKAKTELSIAELIKKHYPQAKFYGFIDGIG